MYKLEFDIPATHMQNRWTVYTGAALPWLQTGEETAGKISGFDFVLASILKVAKGEAVSVI